MIQILLALLTLVIVVGFFVGLIKPAWALPRVSNPSRKKVSMIYISSFIAVMVITLVVGSNKNLVLSIYKNEKRMNVSYAQVFKDLDRGATIRLEPEIDKEYPQEYPLFGERTAHLEEKKGCYKVKVDSRFDEAKTITMFYYDIFNPKDRTCTDKLANVIIFFENILDKKSSTEAIKTIDEIIAKGQQTGTSQRIEKTLDGKKVIINFFPNLRKLSIDVNKE